MLRKKDCSKVAQQASNGWAVAIGRDGDCPEEGYPERARLSFYFSKPPVIGSISIVVCVC
jgi:hypothetical protein